MSIMTDSKGNIFQQFIRIHEEQLGATALDAPLTHALIVAEYQGKYLFLYSKWNRCWELPGGVIEEGETARQCALRELREETNQLLADGDVSFLGLMKFRLQPSYHGPERTEYGALFAGRIRRLEAFTENDEAASIMLWDGVSDAGEEQIAEIDKKLLDYRYGRLEEA